MEDDLRCVCRELASAKRKLRRRSNAAELWWGLTERIVKVAVSIYILSSYNVALAARFAADARRKRKCFENFVGEAPIVAWFVALSFDQLLLLVEPTTAAGRRVKEQAQRYIAGAATASWVRAMNVSNHVAPATDVLLEHYKSSLQKQGIGMTVALEASIDRRHGPSGRYMKLWCQRFRAKWQLRLGKLPTGICIPEGELKQKAWVCKAKPHGHVHF